MQIKIEEINKEKQENNQVQIGDFLLFSHDSHVFKKQFRRVVRGDPSI